MGRKPKYATPEERAVARRESCKLAQRRYRASLTPGDMEALRARQREYVARQRPPERNRAQAAAWRERHPEKARAYNRAGWAIRRARAGHGDALGALTGLSADDALFWFGRLPACTALGSVEKLREIAALQEEQRPTVRRLRDGRTRTGRGHGDFGVVVPFGGDRG